MDHKLCRICLSNTGSILLYEEQSYLKHSEKLMKCMNIKFFEGDGFPDSICADCFQELNIAYNFICKCERSDNILRSKEYDHQSNTYILHPEIKDEMKTEDELHYYLKNNVEDNGEKILSNCGIVESTDPQVKAYYPCDICSSMFSHKESLGKHKSTHHTIQNNSRKHKIAKPSHCGVCGDFIQNSSAMARHMREHKCYKPYSCSMCNKKFALSSSLKRHVRLHRCGERKYVCDICRSEFTSKIDIIEHLKNHEQTSVRENEMYSCNQCSKVYRHVSSLIRHGLSHTGEKSHPCPMCDKSFYRKFDLQRHMKSMHSDRQYSCHICNKVVKNENILMTHLKRHQVIIQEMQMRNAITN